MARAWSDSSLMKKSFPMQSCDDVIVSRSMHAAYNKFVKQLFCMCWGSCCEHEHEHEFLCDAWPYRAGRELKKALRSLNCAILSDQINFHSVASWLSPREVLFMTSRRKKSSSRAKCVSEATKSRSSEKFRSAELEELLMDLLGALLFIQIASWTRKRAQSEKEKQNLSFKDEPSEHTLAPFYASRLLIPKKTQKNSFASAKLLLRVFMYFSQILSMRIILEFISSKAQLCLGAVIALHSVYVQIHQHCHKTPRKKLLAFLCTQFFLPFFDFLLTFFLCLIETRFSRARN